MSDSQFLLLQFWFTRITSPRFRHVSQSFMTIRIRRALQPDNENADISRRYSRNARRLADGRWANFGELLAGFEAETWNDRIIKCIGNHFVFQLFEFFYLQILTVNIPSILHCNLDLLNDFVG